MGPQGNYLTGTIRGSDTRMGDSQNSSSAPAKSSPCERGKRTRSSSGGSLLTTQDNAVSTVQSSEMRADTDHQTLSDRLTPLLIARGLVRGTIPTSIRQECDQLTLGSAFFAQDGGDAE
jgi:hypothetical protein